MADSFHDSSIQMASVSSCQRLSMRSVKASAPPPSRSASGFRVRYPRRYSAPNRPDRAIVSKPGPHFSASRRSGSPTSMSLYTSSAERMPVHVRSSSPALTGAHARRQPPLSSTVLARVTSAHPIARVTASAFLTTSRRAGGGASRAASAGEHPKSNESMVINPTRAILLISVHDVDTSPIAVPSVSELARTPLRHGRKNIGGCAGVWGASHGLCAATTRLACGHMRRPR